MPLTISRIGQARGRPVAQGFGKCGAITRHSASVRSVWYRVTVRLCWCRVVGVHMAIGKIANRHALSDETIDGVGERTGGVPLFVEEVTRLQLERNAQGGAQAIPPTLQQSLAARLDQLGEAREVAQIGAVLGRDFSYRLLRAVGRIDDPALQSAL